MKKILLITQLMFCALVGFSQTASDSTTLKVFILNPNVCTYTLYGNYYSPNYTVTGNITEFTPVDSWITGCGIREHYDTLSFRVPNIDTLTILVWATADSLCNSLGEYQTAGGYTNGTWNQIPAISCIFLVDNDADGDGWMDSEDYYGPLNPSIGPPDQCLVFIDICDGINTDCDGEIDEDCNPISGLQISQDSLFYMHVYLPQSVPSAAPLFTYYLSEASWDFGDGSTSTELYPTHTYAGEGTYTVNFSLSYLVSAVDIPAYTIDSTFTFTLNSDGTYIPGGIQQQLFNLYIDSIPSSIVGMSELKESSMSLYPNPAVESITITNSLNCGVVKVYSADGKCVMIRKFYSPTFKLDVGLLDLGSYIVQISDVLGNTCVGHFIK